MTWLAGVDGCRMGWFRACRDSRTGETRYEILETARALVDTQPRPAIIAIDIPIGLPPSHSRRCDVAARRLLGPRRSSVFPAPIRPAITAGSREDASRTTQQIDGRRVGVQAWAISPKIREVDALLLASDEARERVWEVHPEVSFRAWNGEAPMQWAKKKRAGRRERLRLVEAWLGEGTLERARGDALKKHVADDDILDAIAALWTAERIAKGDHVELPEEPELDARRLPMRIVY